MSKRIETDWLDSEDESNQKNKLYRFKKIPQNVPTGDQHIIINDIFYTVNYIINQRCGAIWFAEGVCSLSLSRQNHDVTK